ncbi:MAG TPA: nucleotidyltransferase domain-containing protein [Ktedonosporobacter sp.]|nr:nucleotidyltransferase domain-containing protein [Ktedonosporobacter sp.]
MAQYEWASCPTPIHTQIQTFCQQAHTILGDALVSMYLHGSLAMGCFNAECSDLDLLVVGHEQMSVDTKRRIMDLLLHLSNAPSPIEISFLVLPGIHPFQHPLFL